MLMLPGVACLAAIAGIGSVVVVTADDCPLGSVFDGSGCVNVEPPGEYGVDGTQTGCSQQSPFVYPAPCSKDGYTYSAAYDAYLRPLEPHENELYRPPDGSLSHLGYWTGDPNEGWIYEWRKLAGVAGGIHWSDYGFMWLADAPGSHPLVVVDPEEVAQGLLDSMEFEAVDIGIAPRPLEDNPDSIGLVGAPVWMWVNNAGPSTWGPLEESATVGGVTVTVTAEVQDVAWDMGDGTTVTCTTPGAAYHPVIGVRPSPSCGHLYVETSGELPDTAYAVTATANWTASWTASSGAEGTLEPPDPATTVHVRIGERQVIETG